MKLRTCGSSSTTRTDFRGVMAAPPLVPRGTTRWAEVPVPRGRSTRNRMARMDGSELGVSRRDFLRAAGVAGALGVSGGLLGARAALGHDGEEHGASHKAGHGAADSGGMSAHG